MGLSAPAVAERVRRMEEAGIITGYHASLNLTKVGLPMTAYVEFTSRDGQTGPAEQLALGHPAVSECYCISGERDLLMRTAFASVNEVEPFLERFTPYGKASTLVVLAVLRARRSVK